MRFIVGFAGLAVILGALACGGNAPAECGPDTCDGCCINNNCVPGTTNAVCGSGGGACTSCGAGQLCLDQVCTAEQPQCGPENCDGCCDGPHCRTGISMDACGTGGAACAVCSAAATCEAGTCADPGPGCSAATCPDGCCEGNVCRSGADAAACGAEGAACVACSSDQICEATTRACAASTPPCAETCDGCCDGETCLAGDGVTACGLGGTACAACTGAERCDAAAGVCVAPSCAETCDGCCDGETCRTGAETGACGTGGAVCTVCGGAEACMAGACLSCPEGATLQADGACACNDNRFQLSTDGTRCEPRAGWTFLVYAIADNNIELATIGELNEMLAVSVGPDLNVVVQVDRAVGFSDMAMGTVGDFTGSRRYEFGANGAVQIGPAQGMVNTGDPGVLADFISWGLQAYPGRRTALVLIDHGGAWIGFGSDDSAGGDLLSIPEIQQAIDLGLSLAGRSHLDFVGFDGCLMGSLEVAHAIADVADVMVGSEDVQMAYAWGRDVMWDWTALLQSVADYPDMDARTLGESAVDSYMPHVIDRGAIFAHDATLSVVDLREVPRLVSALDAVAGRFQTTLVSRGAWVDAARGYVPAQAFFPGQLHGRDLGDFLLRLSGGSSDAQLRPLVDAAILAYYDAVPYQINGVGQPYATGLTVYMPRTPAELGETRGAYGSMTPFGSGTQWLGFLDRYHAEAARDLTPPGISTPAVVATTNQASVTASVTGDDIYKVMTAPLVVTSDAIALVEAGPQSLSASGGLSYDYDWTVPVLSHDGGLTLAPVVYDYDGWVAANLDPNDAFDSYTGHVTVDVSFDGTNWERGTLALVVDAATGDHVVQGVFMAISGIIAQLPLVPGLYLRPVVMQIERATGDVSEMPNQPLLLSGDPPVVTLERWKLPVDSEVFLGVVAQDYAGNKATGVPAQPARVPGLSCSTHTQCGAEEFCDPVGQDCRPVFGTTFTVSGINVSLAGSMDDGSAWDALGGAPDPFATVLVGGVQLGSTAVVSDRFTAAWAETFEVTFYPGDTLVIRVYDSDLTTPDWAGGIEWSDPVGIVRAGAGSFYGGGQLQSLAFSIAP